MAIDYLALLQKSDGFTRHDRTAKTEKSPDTDFTQFLQSADSAKKVDFSPDEPPRLAANDAAQGDDAEVAAAMLGAGFRYLPNVDRIDDLDPAGTWVGADGSTMPVWPPNMDWHSVLVDGYFRPLKKGCLSAALLRS